MAAKRSPSPANDMASDAPPAKEPKVEESGAQPQDDGVEAGPVPTTSDESRGGAPSTAGDNLDTQQEDKDGKESKDGDKDAGGESRDERSATTKVSDLDTVNDLFADGTLQPYRDAEDILYPHSTQLNDKVMLWCAHPSRCRTCPRVADPLHLAPTLALVGVATSPCVSPSPPLGPSQTADSTLLHARRSSRSTASSTRPTRPSSAAAEVRQASSLRAQASKTTDDDASCRCQR